MTDNRRWYLKETCTIPRWLVDICKRNIETNKMDSKTFLNLPKDKQVEVLLDSPGAKKLFEAAKKNGTSFMDEFVTLLDKIINEEETERKMYSLDKLINKFECFETAAGEAGGDHSGLIISGNVYVQAISLEQDQLWNSENDERYWDDAKDEPAETIKEYVLRKLEEKVDFLQQLVRNVRGEEQKQFVKK